MNLIHLFFLLFVIFDLCYNALFGWLDKMTIGQVKRYCLYFWPKKKYGFSFTFTKRDRRCTEFRLGFLRNKRLKDMTVDEVVQLLLKHFPGYKKIMDERRAV